MLKSQQHSDSIPVKVEVPDGLPIENVTGNSLGNIYQAVKRALLRVKKDADDPESGPLFETVAIDTGQFERLISNVRNSEFETALPACFVRFVNVHYLVSQERVSEGRATLRIRFILNRLDNQDPAYETEPSAIHERINAAIQDAKEHEEALQDRCVLTYFDMPTSTHQGQAYWIDYDIWFHLTSGHRYRNWIRRKIITPAFTNYSDIPGDTRADLEEPRYDEQTGFIPGANEE